MHAPGMSDATSACALGFKPHALAACSGMGGGRCDRIQCTACAQWRIITYETLLEVRGNAVWTCASLRSARMFQSMVSQIGFRSTIAPLLPENQSL